MTGISYVIIISFFILTTPKVVSSIINGIENSTGVTTVISGGFTKLNTSVRQLDRSITRRISKP